MKARNTVTGKVIEFSPRWARLRRCQKRVKAWAETVQPYLGQVGDRYRLVMVTLTYAEIDAWRPGHIRDFMLTVRAKLKKSLVGYAWVAELQKRGAVHYHVLLLVEKGTDIPMPDKVGWWPWGSTRIETARSPYYILTYTGKEYQKLGQFPKGLRMFAVWVAEWAVTGVNRWLFRLSTLPTWLKDEALKKASIVGAKFRRVVGGGWEVGGMVYKSPWEIVEFS